MARSYRLAYTKDGSKHTRELHHRAYRRHVKQTLKSWIKDVPYEWAVVTAWDNEIGEYSYILGTHLDPEFKHPNTITDQYDICDWWSGYWCYTTTDPDDKPCGTHWYKKKSKNHVCK